MLETQAMRTALIKKKWDREHKEQKKEYRERNKDKLAKYMKEYQRAWYSRNKIIALVRQETIRNFQKEDVCGLCDSKDKLEFHHFVYLRPVERKHFTTLCTNCHDLVHLKPLINKSEMGRRLSE